MSTAWKIALRKGISFYMAVVCLGAYRANDEADKKLTNDSRYKLLESSDTDMDSTFSSGCLTGLKLVAHQLYCLLKKKSLCTIRDMPKVLFKVRFRSNNFILHFFCRIHSNGTEPQYKY